MYLIRDNQIHGSLLIVQLCSLKYHHKSPFCPFRKRWFYVSVVYVDCVSRVSSHYSNISLEFHSCRIRITPQCNILFIRIKKTNLKLGVITFQRRRSLKMLLFCSDLKSTLSTIKELIFTTTNFCEKMFKLLFHFREN